MRNLRYGTEKKTIKKDIGGETQSYIRQGNSLIGECELKMGSTEHKTLYFHNCGEENTEELLKLVKTRAQEEGINNIVVASTRGVTGVKASKLLKGFNVVAVTHNAGFLVPGKSELDEGNRRKILKNGAKVLTATHALSGVERAVRKKFATIMPLEIMAHTLRLFGEGTKVCVEITLMAADAGLISEDKEIIAIAGTGRGADTALIIKPACTARFFDLEVREVIAKPRNIPKD